MKLTNLVCRADSALPDPLQGVTLRAIDAGDAQNDGSMVRAQVFLALDAEQVGIDRAGLIDPGGRGPPHDHRPCYKPTCCPGPPAFVKGCNIAWQRPVPAQAGWPERSRLRRRPVAARTSGGLRQVESKAGVRIDIRQTYVRPSTAGVDRQGLLSGQPAEPLPGIAGS